MTAKQWVASILAIAFALALAGCEEFLGQGRGPILKIGTNLGVGDCADDTLRVKILPVHGPGLQTIEVQLTNLNTTPVEFEGAITFFAQNRSSTIYEGREVRLEPGANITQALGTRSNKPIANWTDMDLLYYSYSGPTIVRCIFDDQVLPRDLIVH
jgi:hypothetical protein